MKIDQEKFINLYKSQYAALGSSQASGLGTLLGFLEQDRDVGDLRWAAYMLATVKHECANRWQPIEEFGKGQGMAYGNPVPVTGSDGKSYTNTYYGRGYVQLTWEANYRNMSQNLNLGDEVLIHPERALEPSQTVIAQSALRHYRHSRLRDDRRCGRHSVAFLRFPQSCFCLRLRAMCRRRQTKHIHSSCSRGAARHHSGTRRHVLENPLSWESFIPARFMWR
jgi:hypothetical protein